jgi:hypothetical protein
MSVSQKANTTAYEDYLKSISTMRTSSASQQANSIKGATTFRAAQQGTKALQILGPLIDTQRNERDYLVLSLERITTEARTLAQILHFAEGKLGRPWEMGSAPEICTLADKAEYTLEVILTAQRTVQGAMNLISEQNALQRVAGEVLIGMMNPTSRLLTSDPPARLPPPDTRIVDQLERSFVDSIQISIPLLEDVDEEV